MKPKLSKAAGQLREQIDDSFPDRDRTSDGWIGDTRHAARKSDHNPDEQGWVRAIDIDRGNGEFNSMSKSEYDKQQAEQSTPSVIDEAEAK